MKFNLKQFLSIMQIVAPVVLLAVPGGAALAPLVPLIINGIADAEKQQGSTGAEKKAYVLNLVTAAAVGTNIVKPGTINPTLVLEAADHAIDAVISTVNAVQHAHADPPKTTAQPRA